MSLIIPQLLWSFAAILALQQLVNRAGERRPEKTQAGRYRRRGAGRAGLFAYLTSIDIWVPLKSSSKPGGCRTGNGEITGEHRTGCAGGRPQEYFPHRHTEGASRWSNPVWDAGHVCCCGKIRNARFVFIAAILLVLIDLLPVDNTYLHKSGKR